MSGKTQSNHNIPRISGDDVGGMGTAASGLSVVGAGVSNEAGAATTASREETNAVGNVVDDDAGALAFAAVDDIGGAPAFASCLLFTSVPATVATPTVS